MFLFKQIKIEKDTVLVGRPSSEDLIFLSQQGYELVLDIMPSALKDKRLARQVRNVGMRYHHIPVEVCDQESCYLKDEWVSQFFRFMVRAQGPVIINTDDESLGISMVVLSNHFSAGKPFSDVFRAIESLGFSLKGRKDIKKFIKDYYRHDREQKKLSH